MEYFQQVDDAVVALSKDVGFPADQLRYVISLLSLYPLAVIYRMLPNSPTLKHMYNITFGFGLGLWVFGLWGMSHSIITSVVAYVVCLVSPKPQRDVFVWAMGYMCIAHIYRMYIDWMGWSLDFSGPQMLLTVKLTSFAFNYNDGQHPEACDDEQRRLSVKKMPSPLEWFGFVYFFGSFLAGPIFEMKEYLAFTDMSLFTKKALSSKDDVNVWFSQQEAEVAKFTKAFGDVTSGADLKKLNSDAIEARGVPRASAQKLALKFAALPSRDVSTTSPPWGVAAALAKLVGGLVAMGGVILAGTYDVSFMNTEAFFTMSFVERLFYIWVSVSLYRFKYYFGWLVAEGATTLSGMGFNGYYGDDLTRTRWDSITSVYPISVELSQSIKQTMDDWNVGVARWLRRYVYNRIWDSKKGGTAPLRVTLITYLTSAFWHGFYPGYYMTFGSGAVMNEVGRNLRRAFNHRVTGTALKPLYDLGGMVLTAITLSYMTAPFTLLDGWAGLRVWQAQYFFVHIAAVVALVVLPFFIPSDKKKKEGSTEGADKKKDDRPKKVD